MCYMIIEFIFVIISIIMIITYDQTIFTTRALKMLFSMSAEMLEKYINNPFIIYKHKTWVLISKNKKKLK